MFLKLHTMPAYEYTETFYIIVLKAIFVNDITMQPCVSNELLQLRSRVSTISDNIKTIIK